MILFLKFVAAVFVALVLLLVMILMWIRWKVRSMLTSFVGAIQETVPPFRVLLHPESDPDWIHPDEIAAESKKMQALGFTHIGNFDVSPSGMHMQAYVHRDKRTYGTVYDHPMAGVWCDLVRRYNDETGVTYCTSANHGMDPPPKKTVKFFPELELTEVAEMFWNDTSINGVVIVDDDEFPKMFERAYAEEMNWRIERGGPTEAEIRRIAEKDGNECTPEMVQSIQTDWRRRISAFFSERLLNRFRKESKLSRREFSEIEHRLIAVHDRMLPETLLALIDPFYEEDDDDDDFDDFDYDAEDPEIAEMMREEIADQQSALARLKELFTQVTPRQACRQYLEESDLAEKFELFGTIDKPIPGDIWLGPDEEFDEEELFDEYSDDEDEYDQFRLN